MPTLLDPIRIDISDLEARVEELCADPELLAKLYRVRGQKLLCVDLCRLIKINGEPNDPDGSGVIRITMELQGEKDP